jgi:hypothetical protein
MMPLYQSVSWLADGNVEAKSLLSPMLKETEIKILRMIANQRKRKDAVVLEANFVSCLPGE